MSRVTPAADAGPSPPPSGVDREQEPFGSVEWALFLGIAVIWGSSFLLIDIGLEALTPGVISLVRVGSGAVTLLVLHLLGGARGRLEAADRLRILVLAVVWVAIPFTLFPLAQEHINSAVTGLLNGATPIFVTLVGVVLTGRLPKPALIVGLVLGFVGVVLLSLPSIGEGSSQASGVAMVLAATVCYGVAINLATPLQRRYGAVTLMTPILIVASILLVPGAVRDFGDNEWQVRPVVAVLALGIVGTGLAYWIMATLVGRAGPVRASFMTYLMPVVALVLGVLLRQDEVAVLALIGAALTTVGALVASGRIGRLTTTGGPPDSEAT